MDAQLISIIMPCHNAARHIEESIASVQSQTDPNFELVIVDDGSTDDSLAILRSIAKNDSRINITTQENRGVGPARNRGLSMAQGQFVAFLDADDLWRAEFREKMRRALLEREADLAYCGWQNLGVTGGRGDPFIPPDYNRTDKVKAFLGGCRWPIHAALTRRTAIDAVGGFDERWTSCMDYDLWLRIATTHECILVPEVLAFYRHHEGTQITKNKVRVARNQWNIQRKFLKDYPQAFHRLGRQKIRKLTDGELLRRGYACYWQRDLVSARSIFKLVMKTGYGSLRDWKYMLPSLLPLSLHKALINLLGDNS